MFIKVTLARLDEKEKEILISSLINIDDIKKFAVDPSTNKVIIYYKTYNDIQEEYDEIQEDVKTIASRLINCNLYTPDKQ